MKRRKPIDHEWVGYEEIEEEEVDDD